MVHGGDYLEFKIIFNFTTLHSSAQSVIVYQPNWKAVLTNLGIQKNPKRKSLLK
jgi:hypothetical protein